MIDFSYWYVYIVFAVGQATFCANAMNKDRLTSVYFALTAPVVTVCLMIGCITHLKESHYGN